MENPKCPYCGEEQYLTIEDHREIGRMEYYMCIHCGSRSPAKTTTEEAYAAAMKREKKCKTYAEDFNERNPHSMTIEGRPAVCRADVFGGKFPKDCDGYFTGDCVACWNEEMEDEDE